jgi:hypothetical protein
MSQGSSALTNSGQTSSKASDATTYIGVTKSAFDLINSSSPVNQLAYSIVKWLGRERLDESDFTYCLDRSRGLAYPNQYGLEIRERILKSDNRIAKLGGLQLVVPGAIGRWMAFSQDHAYMVTTYAAATKYQSVVFASKVLCEMILANQDGLKEKAKQHFSYSVDRARLSTVLSKVGNSILLNVVNAGHTLGELPSEFETFCIHLVNPETYAAIVLKIAQSDANILLLCDRFQGDLLLWVLAHFEGILEVSVAGKQIFSRAALHGKRRFMMVVKTTWREGEDCKKANHRIELSEMLGGNWKLMLNARDDCQKKVSTSQRHPLYTTLPSEYDRNRDLLNREETLNVKILAQRLLFWIMELPLQASPQSSGIDFETTFHLKEEEVQYRFGDLLYRWPRMLQDISIRSKSSFDLTFKQPERRELEGSDVYYQPDLTPISELCDCFPALDDLLVKVSQRCSCRVCRNNGSVEECKNGCLRHAALSHLFMLIGNGSADRFGVQEASGLTNLDGYVHVVRQLVTEMAIDGFVWWDHCFNVAASTALGYFPKGILGTNSLDGGTGCLLSIQYGATVAVAKWLDLTTSITAHKCFALEMAEGSIPGVQGDLTLIYSETTMPLQCDLSAARRRVPEASDASWSEEITQKDENQVAIDHAIIGLLDDTTCRLVTVISTDSSYRIINPSDAVAGIIRSHFMEATTNECQHRRNAPPGETSVFEVPAEECYLWSFEKLLANWEAEDDTFFFTKILDTDLKANVALSLSAQGCLVRKSSSCLSCAIHAVNTRFDQHHRRIISFERNIQTVIRS